MNNDKIIGVNSPAEHIELERRQHQRRREDQVRTIEQGAELLARERRYALLNAAAIIVRGLTFTSLEPRDVRRTVDAAEMLLTEIERRETEHQRKESE